MEHYIKQEGPRHIFRIFFFIRLTAQLTKSSIIHFLKCFISAHVKVIGLSILEDWSSLQKSWPKHCSQVNNKALDILRYEKPIIELAKTKNTNRNYVARPNHSQRVAVPYT